MRILVTGAAGFIGRHVCNVLQKAHHEVIGLDAVPLMGGNWEETVQADVTKPLPIIDRLDAVIHLAAIAAPRECDKDPGRAFDVNVNGTLQVLRMALASGARKVVFSSSAHVYGVGPRYLPTDESHPVSLGNTYTTTKILGEELCRLYLENHGLSYTTLRLFNVYGQGQSLGYFIPDQIAKREIRLQGGNTTKDWVFVEDVARAFVLATETSYVGPLNIGTGIETQLAPIARFIAERTGATFESTDAADATRMQANAARAGRVLGWHPTVNVWEGLRACLDQAKEPAIRP